MSAEQVASVPDEAVVQKARSMGWVSKEEFKGNEAKWIDADEFVENGQKVLPILRKNNQMLMQSTNALSNEIQALKDQLKARDGELESFQEFHKEELARRVKETRDSIKAQLKQAKDEGDTGTEVELTDQLLRLNTAEREAASAAVPAKSKKDDGDAQVAEQPSAETLAFIRDFPQFASDEEFHFEVLALGARIKKANPELKGQTFFDELRRRLAKAAPPPGKVGESRGGASQGRTGGRTYADLPADAKAACDKWERKLVGPDKKFKDTASFRKFYVEQLEAQE